MNVLAISMWSFSQQQQAARLPYKNGNGTPHRGVATPADDYSQRLASLGLRPRETWQAYNGRIILARREARPPDTIRLP